MEIFIFIMTGVLVGLLAGLFGLGGGVIMVPVLAFIYVAYQFPSSIIMHLAAGTSLTIMMITSCVSVRSYYKRHSILLDTGLLFLPGLLVGVIIGSMLAHFIHTDILKLIFACFLLAVGLYMTYQSFYRVSSPTQNAVINMPSSRQQIGVSFFIGLLSGMLGVGAGSTTIPYLSYYRVPMKKAAGTAAFLSVWIALLGTVVVIIMGWDAAKLNYATGYVYWPAVLSIGIVSVIVTPLGVWLSHHLSQIYLKRIFSLLLLILSLTMFFGKM